jgi:hypothetical protein
MRRPSVQRHHFAIAGACLLTAGAVGWLVTGDWLRVVPAPTASPTASALPPVARASVPPEAPLTPLTCDTPLAYGPEIVARSGTLGPDGHTVALAADLDPVFRFAPKGYTPDLEKRRIQLFDLTTRTVRDLARGAGPILWSASGRLIVFAEPQAFGAQVAIERVIVEVTTGREVARLPPEPHYGAGWEGEAFLYQSGATLRRWTPSSNAVVLHFDGAPVVEVAADGRALAASTFAGDDWRPKRIAVYDLATGSATELPGARSVAWSPVGHRLLVTYIDHTEVRDEDGTVASVPYPVTSWVLQWAPDGRRPLFREPPAIVHASTQVSPLVDYITIDRASADLRLPLSARALGFASDGHLFAAINADGWSASTFRPYLCREEAFQTAPRPTTTTMYYVESDEPWAAARDGTLPSNWRELGTAALRAVEIHPLALELVRPIPFDADAFARCAELCRGNGFVLAATIPYTERERAFAHCFLAGDGTTYVPGGAPARSFAVSYGCDPL